jgi:hypothetical protein
MTADFRPKFGLEVFRITKEEFYPLNGNLLKAGFHVTLEPGYHSWYSDRRVGIRVPVGTRVFLFQAVQTVSRALSACFPMGTGDSSPRGKAAGA